MEDLKMGMIFNFFLPYTLILNCSNDWFLFFMLSFSAVIMKMKTNCQKNWQKNQQLFAYFPPVEVMSLFPPMLKWFINGQFFTDFICFEAL
jgi:hypothetical protein